LIEGCHNSIEQCEKFSLQVVFVDTVARFVFVGAHCTDTVTESLQLREGAMLTSFLIAAVVLLAVALTVSVLMMHMPRIRERDAQARANRRRREIEDAKWRELESCADWRAERHRNSTEAV